TPIAEGLDRTFARAARGPVVLLPDGETNPVRLCDVVDALVTADARDAEVRGVYELGGLQTTSIARLVTQAGRSRMSGPFSPAPRALLDVIGRTNVAEPATSFKLT
ncbi:MAG: hypothetical protein ABR552_03915, partial [Actinomycetota bacterium]